MLLLEHPSTNSIELAVAFTKEVGAGLQDSLPQGIQAVLGRFRDILQESSNEKKIQYSIEGLLAIRRKGFDKSGYPARHETLDVIEARDLITHEIYLDDDIEQDLRLDIFKFDHNYQKHEHEYNQFKNEILYREETEEAQTCELTNEMGEDEDNSLLPTGIIKDKTETNLLNLRRTIYLTIMSSLDFEEAGHKLLKINFCPGQETELVTMIIESCSQERMYTKYFGLLAQRFCQLNRSYQELFEQCFEKQYMLIHRLETNKLRNVAKLFAHLISSDAISWDVLLCVRLTVENTTSSARIFVKIIFQELSEKLGLRKIQERICGSDQAHCFTNIFPRDTTSNIRFSINFFTSIGLGSLTNHQREYLKQLPEPQANAI
jgi:pre-mRNA-splicing factor CWC22